MAKTTTFRNWNGSASSTPQVVAVPKTLEELIDVVKDTANYPSPLRVGGSFHSLNSCFVSEGTQILLTHFNQIQVDTEHLTITVGASRFRRDLIKRAVKLLAFIVCSRGRSLQ